MPLEQVFSIAKDVVVAAAASAGAIVAICGLNTWNRQLKGGAEYELARRILKCAYLLRDAFIRARSPLMLPSEMPAPPKSGMREPTREEVRHFGLSEAYQARWTRIVDARTSLQSELIEAEVLWGKEAIEDFQLLFELQHELMLAIQHLLMMSDPNVSEDRKQSRDRIQSKRRDIIFGDFEDENDAFNIDVAAAIAKIETRFKPYLKK